MRADHAEYAQRLALAGECRSEALRPVFHVPARVLRIERLERSSDVFPARFDHAVYRGHHGGRSLWGKRVEMKRLTGEGQVVIQLETVAESLQAAAAEMPENALVGDEFAPIVQVQRNRQGVEIRLDDHDRGGVAQEGVVRRPIDSLEEPAEVEPLEDVRAGHEFVDALGHLSGVFERLVVGEKRRPPPPAIVVAAANVHRAILVRPKLEVVSPFRPGLSNRANIDASARQGGQVRLEPLFVGRPGDRFAVHAGERVLQVPNLRPRFRRHRSVIVEQRSRRREQTEFQILLHHAQSNLDVVWNLVQIGLRKGQKIIRAASAKKLF